MAKAMRVRGLACPFNVENCYNETMEAHAFDAWLERLGGVKALDGFIEADDVDLPMRVMHDDSLTIGTWDRLWTSRDGLWCEGTIEPRFAADAPHDGELSISFSSGDDKDGITARRVNEIAQREHWNMFETLGAMVSRGLHLEKHKVQHRDVELSEISLVDHGAFDGTHWEVI